MTGKLGDVSYEIKNGKLLLEIDLNTQGTLSKSGKSQVIATTHGNKVIPEISLTLGLNLYKK